MDQLRNTDVLGCLPCLHLLTLTESESLGVDLGLDMVIGSTSDISVCSWLRVRVKVFSIYCIDMETEVRRD